MPITCTDFTTKTFFVCSEITAEWFCSTMEHFMTYASHAKAHNEIIILTADGDQPLELRTITSTPQCKSIFTNDLRLDEEKQ